MHVNAICVMSGGGAGIKNGGRASCGMRLKVRAESGDLLWRRRRGRGDIAV